MRLHLKLLNEIIGGDFRYLLWVVGLKWLGLGDEVMYMEVPSKIDTNWCGLSHIVVKMNFSKGYVSSCVFKPLSHGLVLCFAWGKAKAK